tara:strand:- start:791 stop:1402 length:612 start_codon:yes stop_codon:yes gene_type:complete
MLLKDIFSFGEITLLSEGRANGNVKFRGIFSEAERPNGNKRVYNRPLLEREVKKLQKQITDRRLLGELDHPSDEIVHLGNVSHVITKLNMHGNHVMGEGEVLNTPAGKVLTELLKAGVKLGISSRGTGSVDLDESGSNYVVGENYSMITFDMVSEPSSQDAFPSLSEGKAVVSEARQPIVEELEHFHNDRIYITALKRKLGKI